MGTKQVICLLSAFGAELTRREAEWRRTRFDRAGPNTLHLCPPIPMVPRIYKVAHWMDESYTQEPLAKLEQARTAKDAGRCPQKARQPTDDTCSERRKLEQARNCVISARHQTTHGETTSCSFEVATMRCPYVPQDAQGKNDSEAAIIERVRKRRGAAGLLTLDRTLLHSPQVADGWNSFLGAVRTGTSLAPILRESLICRVAILNNAVFEWDHHSVILTGAGFPEASLGLLRRRNLQDADSAELKKILGPGEMAALAYADQMTLSVDIDDEVFRPLVNYYTTQEIVEITTTVGAYNCVSRVLVALDIDERRESGAPYMLID